MTPKEQIYATLKGDARDRVAVTPKENIRAFCPCEASLISEELKR